MDEVIGTGPGAAVLLVLACPVPGGDGDPAYLLHQVGGVTCVLAYTDLERLVRCCGEHQPWMAVPRPALLADLRDQRLAGPAMNLPLSPDLRWSADGPPWDLAGLPVVAGDHADGGVP